MLQHKRHPEAEEPRVLQHFWDIFFLLVSKKWAGGNGSPQSMPRMTQPACSSEWRGCKDRQEGSGLAQDAGHGHCNENLRWHSMLCALCKMFVPVGFCLTGSTLQCKSYVLLSWYFILALGAAEIIKRPFRKRLKLSLKSQGGVNWVFLNQTLSAMH